MSKAKFIAVVIPIFILAIYMFVGCQGGSDPLLPDSESGNPLSGEAPVVENQNNADMEAFNEAANLRLTEQNALPAAGEVNFGVLSELPVQAGNDITIAVNLGNVTDVFAIACEFGFDNRVLGFRSYDIADSILGDDLLVLADEFVEGEIGLGLTRKRGADGSVTGISGSGKLISITFTALQNIESIDDLNMSLLDDRTVPRYMRVDRTEVRFDPERSGQILIAGGEF